MVSRTVIIVCSIIGVAVIGLTIGLTIWGVNRSTDTEEDPVVVTDVGTFRGLRASDGEYSKFLGIPYAVVDEANPFGPATSHPGFQETFIAQELATMCPQMVDGQAVGDIQCLELDIYVPDGATEDNLLPVLVFIHGGDWVEGSTEREGSRSQFLLRHDVIVVAINYRLGIFGFLCADIPEAPGNRGLKDQALALKWIKQNIKAFGADPDKITVSGQSAGGMSTNLHLYSPQEKVFDKAIILAGPALSYSLFVKSHPMVPFQLAEYFGYYTTNAGDAMSYLSSLDPMLIVVTAFDLNISNSQGVNQPLTKPCVEQTFDGVESFITEHPMNIHGARKINDTSIIIGHNNQELGFMINEDLNNYQFTDQLYMGFNEVDDLDEGVKSLMHFYIGDEPISVNVSQGIVNYATDMIFGHSTYRMIKQFLSDNAKSVYRYVFSYKGGRNMLQVLNDVNVQGAIHADEIGYIFDLEMFETQPSAADQLVIDRFTTLLTNFVKYGNPTPESTTLLPVIWTPVTERTQPHLDINSDVTLQGRPTHQRIAFLDLFYKIYGKYQMWYQ